MELRELTVSEKAAVTSLVNATASRRADDIAAAAAALNSVLPGTAGVAMAVAAASLVDAAGMTGVQPAAVAANLDFRGGDADLSVEDATTVIRWVVERDTLAPTGPAELPAVLSAVVARVAEHLAAGSDDRDAFESSVAAAVDMALVPA